MVSNRGGSTQSNKNGGSVQDKAESAISTELQHILLNFSKGLSSFI